MRILLALLVAVLLLQRPAEANGGSIGFVLLTVPDGVGPAIEVALWYPSIGAVTRPVRVGAFLQDVAPGAGLRGSALPLVVISHGSGGFFASHADTALALAQAGFIVAAPTHTGDNYRDGSATTDIGARTRHVATVVGFVMNHWNPSGIETPVDARRIGAFGFSAGGFTVLAASGGRPDLSQITGHCAANPAFYDCRLMGPVPMLGVAPQLVALPHSLRALVVAAPALGFTFGAGSLDTVTMPVQLWQAGLDTVLPAPFYVEPVRAALPHGPEFHRVESAGHFDFLAPCTVDLARAVPSICASADGFDRAAFHERFNTEVVRFMTAAMPP